MTFIIKCIFLAVQTGGNGSDIFRQKLVELLPRLRRFAYTLTSNRYDADDLVQAACERALTKKDLFKSDTKMDSWMFKIIHRIRIDMSRSSHSSRSESSFDEAYNSLEGGNSSNENENRIFLKQTMQAMQTMSEKERTLLALVCVDGRSYKETAEILSVPVGTVMSRLARARTRLYDLIHKDNK
jgi:RNA polymerase sigma-70 factor (ECF subfamily)